MRELDLPAIHETDLATFSSSIRTEGVIAGTTTVEELQGLLRVGALYGREKGDPPLRRDQLLPVVDQVDGGSVSLTVYTRL